MKYNIFFLLIFMLIAASGCKYFKRPAPENVSTISADTTQRVTELPDSAYFAPPQNNALAAGTPSGNYYMIVGCFTVPANAESYASGLRQKGYNAVIIAGRDNFQMVAAQTYSDYKTSISEIDKYRNEVTPSAWVHVNR